MSDGGAETSDRVAAKRTYARAARRGKVVAQANVTRWERKLM